MQYKTNLGMSIGQLLSSGMGSSGAYQQGQMAGADLRYRQAAANKLETETESEKQAQYARSDKGITEMLLDGVGANNEQGSRDYDAFRSGTYKNPTQPLAFVDGGGELPAPEYVSMFPDLQKTHSTLRQMIAVGDKDLTHLPKTIQGDQRNRITANLDKATPQEAVEIGMRTAALENNVNPLEMQKAALTYGLTKGNNSLEAQNALLLAQGKTRFDNTGDVGTMDLLTGDQRLNVIGTSAADENKGQAAQANSAAVLNKAKVGQTISATSLNNANTGLVQAKTANERVKSLKANEKVAQGTAKLPTPALKMQQEELETIGTMSGTNADLKKIKDDIKNGVLELGPFTNFMSGAKNATGYSDEASRGFETLKTTLEKARNASLLLNKGVQTDGDAQRAWNELISNLNDPKNVEKRLEEIVGFNERAVKLRKAKVNNLRRNYNAEPMDFSEFDSQKSSIQGTGSSNLPSVSNW